MAKIAVFVIDIQVGLAQHRTEEIPNAARIRDAGELVVSKARRSIDAAREQGEQPNVTIVFVRHAEPPEEGMLFKGSPAWELVLKPRQGDAEERVVDKTTGDTFASNPELASELKAQGVDRIVALGIQSECCVQATCKGALAAGFNVTLLQGAHSTYNGDTKTAEEIEKEVETKLKALGVLLANHGDWQP